MSKKSERESVMFQNPKMPREPRRSLYRAMNLRFRG